jgi:hypothetical protein
MPLAVSRVRGEHETKHNGPEYNFNTRDNQMRAVAMEAFEFAVAFRKEEVCE